MSLFYFIFFLFSSDFLQLFLLSESVPFYVLFFLINAFVLDLLLQLNIVNINQQTFCLSFPNQLSVGWSLLYSGDSSAVLVEISY